jgi:phage terminase small subunit
MSQDLKPKQQRFVEEYLVDLNGKQAAIRVGYSAKTAEVQASRLLSNAKVSAAIAEARQKLSERTEITQEWVLNNIRTVAERCMQAAPVFDRKGNRVMVETPDGEMAPAFVFDSGGANRSLELLGKHLGMFGDKLELNARVSLSHEDALNQLDEPDDAA